MGNTLSAIWQARGGEGDYITAHSVVGWSGHPIGDIDKQGGDRSFIAALAEVTVFKALAEAEGKTYGVGGIILTHGEADATNPTYGASVYQMWQDYNTDIKAITGQTRDVVLLASQQSASVSGRIANADLEGRRRPPGPARVHRPKYQYRPYGLHFPGGGYERLGEKYAEVFDLIVNQGVDWKPVGPNNITRAGAVVTITFDVPNPPLQWDENLVMPHQAAHTAWANGRGFEVKDSSNNEIAIASVGIVGDDTVVLTLAADPGSTSLTLGYAITQDSPDAYQGGADGGPHGQLRDSDEFVG